MLAEAIHALMRDVQRLVAAGSASAANDEGLHKRLCLLQPLGERVPALAALVVAVERVTTSPLNQAAAALLDLLVLVRQITAALAAKGLDSPMQALPECGPWSTPAAIEDLFALHELESRPVSRKRADRAELLQRASERGTAADLRNVAVFLDLLAGPYSPAVGVLLTEVLPFFGRALLPDLRVNLHRGLLFVVALARYDEETALGSATVFLQCSSGLLPLLPRMGQDAVRAFLAELAEQPAHVASELDLQKGAALALGRMGQPALRFLLDLLQTPEQVSPCLVLDALAELGPLAGEAVPVLLRMLDDPSEQLRRSTILALGRIGPPARAAIPALRKILNQWGQTELQMLAMDALGGITRSVEENA